MMAVVAVAEISALAMERRTFLSAAMGAGITAPLYGCGAQPKLRAECHSRKSSPTFPSLCRDIIQKQRGREAGQ